MGVELSAATVLGILAIVPALVGIAVLVTTVRGLRHFTSLPFAPAGKRRSVSVISPACDEAETIASAVRSMLTSADEVIVVNDRSSDDTGVILDRLSREQTRLKVIHNEELAKGWLGKVHALDLGTRAATGDWLLFADADAHLGPDTIGRATSYMDREKVDFLSLVPRIESVGFWGDTAFALAQAILSLGTRVWAIGDPNTSAIGASGAFMLVRRDAFEKTPGFEWLRMEVADDFGLCLLIKTHGGRCALLNGADAVSISWYASFSEMARRMQKNFFAITGRCQPWRCVLHGMLATVLAISPLGLLVGGAAAAVTAVGTASMVLASLMAALRFRRPLLPALAVHLGALLWAYIVVRAAWIGSRIGGVKWRGVHYSSQEINAGRRVVV